MKTYSNNVKRIMSKNASDLLLIGGVACILGGGALAIKQTPKAVKLMEEKKDKDTIEKVKTISPLYIPSIILTGVGIAQIVCSRNITNNKIAAITTAYTVSETAFKTYKEKVKEIVEPEKYEEIKREVASEQLKRDPISNKEVIVTTKGDSLIYDNMSGRYFKSSINDIERAANYLNRKLRNEMSIDLNDFYLEVGLLPIKIGCEVGWHIDEGELEPSFSSTIAEDGTPCLVLDYDVVPIH
jgi:hypothetical protein